MYFKSVLKTLIRIISALPWIWWQQ